MKRASLQKLAPLRLRHFQRRANRFPELGATARLRNLSRATIELVWVSDAQMKRLNGKYRKKHRVTDVLSFPAPPGWPQATAKAKAGEALGSIVICSGQLKRQARALGHSPEDELDVLLVHGLLHLLGFDHELGPKAARKMGRWELRLLGSKKAGLIERTRLE